MGQTASAGRADVPTPPLSTNADAVALQKKINEVAKPFMKPPNFLYGLGLVARDFVYCSIIALITHLVSPYVPNYVLLPVYSVIMGTAAGGFWVLAHECGHGSFGATKWQNDSVGFVLHSALLVPYWSWQYSHNKHHKYTNHIILGETHVPTLEGDPVIGDAFPLLRILLLHLGMPIYLLGIANSSATQADLKTPMDKTQFKDHFHSGSQIMPNDWRIEASTLGCVATLGCLAYAASIYGSAAVGFWYFGPLLITNAYLILYTWLQHTHPDVPHYGSDSYTRLKGALTTIDRPYTWIVDHCHHHIGSTHVAHHLCSGVPCYRAGALTEALKPVLGGLYLFDPTPIYAAVWEAAVTCHHIKGTEGTQYYYKKDGSENSGNMQQLRTLASHAPTNKKSN